MKKILVTGVAGFIGSNVAKKLIDSDNTVLGIDNLNTYYDVNLKKYRLNSLFFHKNAKNFNFKKIDISDIDLLRDTIKFFNPDLIINLAAQAGVRYSLQNPSSYMSSNLQGFFNILEISKEIGLKKIIYASSSSVYGNTKKIPFIEDINNINPISLYAATKSSNEMLANSYAYNFDMSIIGLRFFTVYGPAGRPDMAYYNFTKKIENNELITIYNEGKMSRDMTYIDDITQGVCSSVDYLDSMKRNVHQIFNLGNENPISVMKLVDFISNKLNIKYRYEYKKLNTEVDITYADISKSKKYLGYFPTTSFENGMDNFIDWYQSRKKEFK